MHDINSVIVTEMAGSQSFCVDLGMTGGYKCLCDDLPNLGEYLVEKSFFFSYPNLVCDSPSRAHWFSIN
jgi:hypothetical protein